MKNRRFTAGMVVLLMAAMMALPGIIAVSGAAAADDGSAAWTLMVLHTNDTHSHLGNAARRATIIKELRARAANSLLVDAGDFTTGDLYFNQYNGQADVDMLNRLGYDAVTTGNHEYDFGAARLAEYLQTADFPVVNANFDYSAEPALTGHISAAIGEEGKDQLSGKVFPAVIVDVNGQKVGIMGLTTPETQEASSPGPNIIEKDFVTAAANTVDKLEQKGINKIIALTHVGWEADLKLAAQVEGIDLIVGGHTHTVPAIYPTVVDEDGTPTLVVQAGSNAEQLGHINIKFDSRGVVLAGQSGGALLTVDGVDESHNYLYEQDPDIKAVVDEYDQAFEVLRSTVIGHSDIFLNGERQAVRSRETNLGDLLADVMLEKSAPYGTSAAVINGGGIRASIGAGDITMGQVKTMLPFGNTLAVVEITGQQLLEALENGVSMADDMENLGGRFPQVAGLKYSFAPQSPVGQRISNVRIKNGNGCYQPLQTEKYYKIATINYMANGGDGYTSFKEARSIYYPGFVDYDIVAEYLGGHSPVNPRLEGRITVGYKDGTGLFWQEWPSPDWPSATIVSHGKTWTASFNQGFDVQTVSSSTIYVIDENGTNMNLTVNPQSDNKSVTIDPPSGGYQPGNYTLCIKGVKSLTGRQMLAPVSYPFTVE